MQTVNKYFKLNSSKFIMIISTWLTLKTDDIKLKTRAINQNLTA